MQRINLGKPYEEYIKKMIETGYFGTATEVIRDALRDKMGVGSQLDHSNLIRLVEEGEKSLKEGKTVKYHPDSIAETRARAQAALKKQSVVPSNIH